VKKMILILAAFGSLVSGAYFSNYLFAQGTGGTGSPTATAQQGTKVAVVNIGHVFNKYRRAIAFKKELETTLEPFKGKAKKLTDEITGWTQQVQKGEVKKENIPHYEAAIVKHRRELEDMERTVKDLLGKKQEDNLVTLWKEVNMGVKAVADAYGYHIVLGFGDPMEKEMLDLFPNINRKMQAMDLGSTVPLYYQASVDLSSAVSETLNRWTESNPPAQQTQGTPTSGTKK
jgi:Skp family chaperone for outer membrane proteins